MLLSIDLKKNYLLAKADTPDNRRAMAQQYLEYAVSRYKPFPDLCEEALAKSRELSNQAIVPLLGGRLMQAASRILGWKRAIDLKSKLVNA